MTDPSASAIPPGLRARLEETAKRPCPVCAHSTEAHVQASRDCPCCAKVGGLIRTIRRGQL